MFLHSWPKLMAAVYENRLEQKSWQIYSELTIGSPCVHSPHKELLPVFFCAMGGLHLHLYKVTSHVSAVSIHIERDNAFTKVLWSKEIRTFDKSPIYMLQHWSLTSSYKKPNLAKTVYGKFTNLCRDILNLYSILLENMQERRGWSGLVKGNYGDCTSKLDS